MQRIVNGAGQSARCQNLVSLTHAGKTALTLRLVDTKGRETLEAGNPRNA